MSRKSGARYHDRLLGKHIVVVWFLFLAGCFADVQHLPSAQPGVFKTIAPPAADTVIGVALSGGGSRAAYFGAAGLEALAHLHRDGNKASLLEHLSYLSSVSGGSVASAYFATKKPGKETPVLSEKYSLTNEYEKFFETYLDTMASNIQGRMEWKQVYKVRWGHSNQRATSLAEVLDDKFLHGATFQDLYKREEAGDTPRLILNATFYNSGRRAAMTTLPGAAFNYDFIKRLQDELQATASPGASIPPLPISLVNAQRALIPQTFEDVGADSRAIPLSRAVAASASFPPLIGPITVQIQGEENNIYHHVGDGGLFDNQGTESLVQLLLKFQEQKQIKRALIIAFDSSFPFTANIDKLNHMEDGFEIFTHDPGRIVGVMEVRANAYQSALWHILQTKHILLPDDRHFKVVVLRHTDDMWPDNWRNLVPTSCAIEAKAWKDKKDIVQHLALIPTLFKINSECDRALLGTAAKLAVEKKRDEIQQFLSN
jgi:predicted acylesterase/phospholipase RssA